MFNHLGSQIKLWPCLPRLCFGTWPANSLCGETERSFRGPWVFGGSLAVASGASDIIWLGPYPLKAFDGWFGVHICTSVYTPVRRRPVYTSVHQCTHLSSAARPRGHVPVSGALIGICDRHNARVTYGRRVDTWVITDSNFFASRLPTHLPPAHPRGARPRDALIRICATVIIGSQKKNSRQLSACLLHFKPSSVSIQPLAGQLSTTHSFTFPTPH